ncbi:MAG TPA: CotS family spore coat protein [Symbiobacteriaceae bacterium]|nr:CotS family spore coat protein [Symbiobacteriaceae bacterium]
MQPFQNHTIFVPAGAPTLVSNGVQVQYLAQPQAESSTVRGWQAAAEGAPASGRTNRQISSGAGAQNGRPWRPPADGKGWVPTGDLAQAAAKDAWQSSGENLVVPPELEAEARSAAESWAMTMGEMQVMATKPEFGGAIWRIETDHGPRSLKRLHRPIPRSLFSVYAQVYLKEKGARVPAIIPAKDGSMAVAKDEKLWIVTDWIEGLVPANKDVVDGAAALCYGLGEFHRISQGYVPPPQAKVASRLHRWPAVYEKTKRKFDWFRQIALRYPEMPASGALLNALPRFETQVDQAMTRLANSPYASLAALGGPANGLVHQDYGYSNGQIGPGGVWLIDLDGVAYDFGIRDLRKLVSSQMDDMGTWDMNWLWSMAEAYRSANPIGPELWELFLIDLALPNEFYKLCAEVVWSPQSLSAELAAMIDRLLQVDQRKLDALRALGVAVK